MPPRPLTFADLPLFASERDLAVALMGPERACEWKALSPLYERQGLPKIDPMTGGRYTPAVKAFFDHQYRLAAVEPAAPHGTERPEVWTVNGQRRRA